MGMPRWRSVAVIALSVLASSGCAGRWKDYYARRVTLPRPADGFEVALAVVQEAGYRAIEIDHDRRRLRVISRIDGDNGLWWPGPPMPTADAVGRVGPGNVPIQYTGRRITILSFEVRPDAVMVISAAGYHRRDGKVHRQVDDELDWLKATIERRLQAPGGAQASTAE
jgi:hypothetical protein